MPGSLEEIEAGGEPDPGLLVSQYHQLGDATYWADEYEAAAERWQKALEASRQAGNRQGEADALWRLGDVARMQARYEDAEMLYQQALPLYRQIGVRLGEANH